MAMESEPACLTLSRLAVARPRSRSTRSSRLSSGSLNLKSLQGKAGSIPQLRDVLLKMQLPLWKAALCWHELVAIEMLFDVQLNPYERGLQRLRGGSKRSVVHPSRTGHGS